MHFFSPVWNNMAIATNITEGENRFFPLEYPSLRLNDIQDDVQWLQGKALDDGAEGLWRMYDGLYDLTDFVDKHPGGKDWLRLTKGTDITEAFESHHISTYPATVLKQFYIREAVTKRNSVFTFHEDGFYKVLKKRIREELKNVPKNVEHQSDRVIVALALATFALSILTCRAESYALKAVLSVMAGLSLAWTSICAHNFVHQKDNWRMYLFNLSTITFKEWRVSHILSHHMYPNTLKDLEISAFEPLITWLPYTQKTSFVRFAPWFYSVVIYVNLFFLQTLKRLFRMREDKALPRVDLDNAVTLSLPLAMFLLGGGELMAAVVSWLVILAIASFVFAFICVNVAHHHPDIFHEGDEPLENMDWGLHQVDTVMERNDITGSLFKVLVLFGDHCLHHLFPTLDHAVLPFLYPAFEEICEKFGTKLKTSSSIELIKGQFQQIARNKPKKRL